MLVNRFYFSTTTQKEISMANGKKHVFIYGALFLLAGCANYTASPLSSLSQDNAILSHQSSGIVASWKTFDKKDCQTYLGRDVLSEGYVPVQMTISNNSKDPIYLSADNFSIPLAPPLQVARKVHTSTAGRVAAWGAGGLIFWPLLVPAVYDGIKSSEANQILDDDYRFKALKEHTIQPQATLNSIVFIPEDQINQRIEMFLVNERTQEKTVFQVVK